MPITYSSVGDSVLPEAAIISGTPDTLDSQIQRMSDQQTLFAHGASIDNFAISKDPPDETSFYDSLMRDRAIIRHSEMPGGLLMDRGPVSDMLWREYLNIPQRPAWDRSTAVIPGFMGAQTRRQLGDGLVNQAMEHNPMARWMLSDPVAEAQQAVDPKFNGSEYWEFLKKNDPDLAAYVTVDGTPETMFTETRTLPMFLATIRAKANLRRAEQNLETFNDQAGFFKNVSGKALSSVVNYFIADPDTVPFTLATAGIGPAIKIVQAGYATAKASRLAGTAATAWAYRAARATEAASALNQWGARLSKLAPYAESGGYLAVRGEKERQDYNDLMGTIYGTENYSRPYSTVDIVRNFGTGVAFMGLTKAVGIGMRAVKSQYHKNLLAGQMAGLPKDSPLMVLNSDMPEAIAAHEAEVASRLSATASITELTGTDQLHFAVDAEILRQTNLDVHAVEEVISHLKTLRASGVDLTPESMQAVLNDFLTAAVEHAKKPGKAISAADARVIAKDGAKRVKKAKAKEPTVSASKTRQEAHDETVADIQAGTPISENLPADLAGAKPRYSYGVKGFSLQFESDVDKAAYISAQAKLSKADKRYVEFVSAVTGMSEKDIRTAGATIKAYIKPRAKDAKNGEIISIPRHLKGKKPKAVRPAPKEVVEVKTPTQKVKYRLVEVPTADLLGEVRAATKAETAKGAFSKSLHKVDGEWVIGDESLLDDALVAEKSTVKLYVPEELATEHGWIGHIAELAPGEKIKPRYSLNTWESKMGKNLRKLNEYLQAKGKIEAQLISTSLSAEQRAALVKELKGYKSGITRIKNSLNKEFPSAVKESVKSDSPANWGEMDENEQAVALRKALDSGEIRIPTNRVILWTNLSSKVMNILGANGWFRRWLTDKTGAENTVYSVNKWIGMGMEFMGDPQRLRTIMFTNPESSVHTAWAASYQAKVAAGRVFLVVREHMDWINANGGRDTVFKGLIKHYLAGTIPDTMQGQAILKEVSHLIKLGRESGLRSGTYTKDMVAQSNHFPMFPNYGPARAGREHWTQGIAKYFLAGYLPEDAPLSRRTMEMLGWVREVKPGEWKPAEESGFITVPATRKSLSLEQVKTYDSALRNLKNEQGRTACEEGAHQYVSELLKESVVLNDASKPEIMAAMKRAHKRENFREERVVGQDLFETQPDMLQYYVTDVADLSELYRAKLYRLLADEVVSTQFQKPGLRLNETLNALEAQAIRDAPEAQAVFKAAFQKFREVHQFWGGGLPSVTDPNAPISNAMWTASRKITQEIMGGMMSMMGLGVEQPISILARNGLRPHDYVNSLIHHFKILLPKLSRQAEQDYFVSSSLATEHMRMGITNRWGMGDAEVPAIDITPAEQWINPWKRAGDILSGKSVPAPGKSRLREGISEVGTAAINTTMRAGLQQWSQRQSNIQHGFSLWRETARYLPKAMKLAELQKEINYQAIIDSEFAKAVERGIDPSTAAKQADAAAWKIFAGLARQAGFGPLEGQYVAARFQRSGILNKETLKVLMEAGQATKGLKSDGLFPMMNPRLMLEHVEHLPAEQAKLLEATVDNLSREITAVIEKRVSVSGPFSTPTGIPFRTPQGRAFLMLSHFMRGFAYNNLLDIGAVSATAATGFVLANLYFEGQVYLVRRLMNGENWADIEDEIRKNPTLFLAKVASRPAFLGQFSALPQVATNLFSGEKVSAQIGPAAVIGVMNKIYGAANDVVKSVYAGANGEPVTLKPGTIQLGQQAIPILNAWYFQALANQFLYSEGKNAGRSGKAAILHESPFYNSVPNYTNFSDAELTKYIQSKPNSNTILKQEKQ